MTWGPLQLAIPEQPKNEKISNFVNQILAAKRNNPEADTSTLESKIDHLVYVLYDLTKDEIAIIDENVRNV